MSELCEYIHKSWCFLIHIDDCFNLLLQKIKTMPYSEDTHFSANLSSYAVFSRKSCEPNMRESKAELNSESVLFKYLI